MLDNEDVQIRVRHKDELSFLLENQRNFFEIFYSGKIKHNYQKRRKFFNCLKYPHFKNKINLSIILQKIIKKVDQPKRMAQDRLKPRAANMVVLGFGQFGCPKNQSPQGQSCNKKKIEIFKPLLAAPKSHEQQDLVAPLRGCHRLLVMASGCYVNKKKVGERSSYYQKTFLL